MGKKLSDIFAILEKEREEKEEVDSELKNVEEARKVFHSQGQEDEDAKVTFYDVLEKFYMYLCYIMKKHGLYFREGEDMRLAVLKR